MTNAVNDRIDSPEIAAGKVAVVVPTYNEAENIGILIERLEALREKLSIIVVDDNSRDGTAEIAANLNKRWGNVFILRRQGKLGIGSAIRDGMRQALSMDDCQYVVTMDADLSHNPDDIPGLLKLAREGQADLIQGSRYIKNGGVIGWDFRRKLLSRTANLIGKILFGLPNEVTTYFRVYNRRSAAVVVDKVKADKYEFAVASALAIKDEGLTIKESPIVFVNRTRGKSKLKTADLVNWFSVISKIFLTRQIERFNIRMFFKFCVVGGSGVLVNSGLLWFLTERLGLFYVVSASLSIETSILTNFVLNDVWTFRGKRKKDSKAASRLLKYNAVCLAGAGLNLGILILLVQGFGVHYLIANLCGIAAATIWNYAASIKWAWR